MARDFVVIPLLLPLVDGGGERGQMQDEYQNRNDYTNVRSENPTMLQLFFEFRC